MTAHGQVSHCGKSIDEQPRPLPHPPGHVMPWHEFSVHLTSHAHEEPQLTVLHELLPAQSTSNAPVPLDRLRHEP